MITFHKVSQKYGDKTILNNIELNIPEGKLTAIVGSNGSGKSTLLKTITRLIPIYEGDILIDGQTVYEKHIDMAKTISLLRQNHQVALKLKAYDLVSFGRYPYSKGRLKPEDHDMVNRIMDYLEISHLKDRYIDTLSGGEFQRTMLAMILVQDTKYILLDEPLNHLDIHYSLDMMYLLQQFIKDFNKTIVIIMHDLNMAAAYCDYAIGLKKGEVVFQGEIDDLMNEDVLAKIFDYPIQVHSVCDQKVCVYKKL
ncbi:ATP-binding cassette domain-containing protein [Acholeplasma equirhinis]|uniref:ATP-binding cassette domain-containing protein n=1 Tax=Acholeplasma equirhinis TaxID=555393 RepID=UPI00197ADD33|nr:ATP-binding cassette domain-containing protein [Acholeplasma equirhinis]MBN3491017.1 ATP-binding cassette domain-containing protein [Acholeplasma equirhinis]